LYRVILSFFQRTFHTEIEFDLGLGAGWPDGDLGVVLRDKLEHIGFGQFDMDGFTRLRIQGYRQAMIDKGHEGEIRVTEEKDFKEWVRMDNLRHVARGIIDFWMRDKSSTAIFIDNDWLAYEIMAECKISGIRIPEDLSLMGIGDYAFSRLPFVGLSTVASQKQKPMGSGAAKLLMSRLNGNDEPRQDIILPIEVILRSTTKTVS